MTMNIVFLKVLEAMLLLLFHLQFQLLVSHSWSAVGTEVRCLERERKALLDLKAGFVDDSGLLSSWGHEEEKRDCCRWERVSCSNQTGHVQMLHLQGDKFRTGRALSGKISTSLMELQHLRYLNLSLNDFEDSYISEFFGSLRNLRYLDLSNSSFVGKIPYQLGSLSHLRHLDLSENYLIGPIPSQLGNLSHLTYLNLRWNYIGGSCIPEFFCSLSNLRYLDVSQSYFTGKIPVKLGSLSLLRHLDLSRNFNLEGAIPSQLGNLSQLQYLDVSENYLIGLIPYQLGNLSQLQHLDLCRNSLVGPIPFQLGNLSSLQKLYLGYNPALKIQLDNSADSQWLSDLTSLTVLDLSRVLYLNHSHNRQQMTNKLQNLRELSLVGCNISDYDLPSKFNFSSLTMLDLSENNLSARFLKSLGNICTLRTLILNRVNLSEDFSTILHDLSGCASDTLQELSLMYNRITGSLSNVSKFPSLKSLNLYDNQLNGTLENTRLPHQLEILDVSSNSIKGGIPESFGKICSLRSLHLLNNSLSNELSVIIHNLFACARSLQELGLSSNQIIGTIPELSKFSSLVELDLSGNQLNGEIPKDIVFPSKLVTLKIASNSELKGVISDSHFANMSKLKTLDLSFTSLTMTFSPEWVPSFQLSQIKLYSCTKLGPQFPKWLQTQKSVTLLDISDSKISDTVPEWFWSLSPRLYYLNISYNNLTGTIPSDSIGYTALSFVTLASNHFEGSIPPFLRSAFSVDLSRNRFSSLSMFACSNSSLGGMLYSLDISNNHLSGQLPNCWNDFKSLVYFDVSDNNLFGKIPSSMGALVELQALILRNNKFSGDLPMSLKNCTNLVMIDVGENRFSGKIPSWIGNAFNELRMLSLRNNHFSGSIPLDLCHLTSLQFLDLSLNSLSGEILKCLNNFTAMSQKEMTENFIYILSVGSGEATHFYDFNALVTWKGAEQKFKNSAFLLRSIDLSSNHLTGGIPTGITNLIELVSLNLSRNNLTGKIPSEIGRLTSLDCLDLSRNYLYGKIPSSLAQIDRLAMLDLSHNQLSGRIPTSTQLQSFNSSSFEENLNLCGKPLEKECPEEGAAQKPPKVEENEQSTFYQSFYISMALGFNAGFWGIFGSIMVNRSWRHAYFRFVNNLTDAIYVMVAINVAKYRVWLNSQQEKWFR